LRDEYGLHLAEEFFELPLDSITGAKLVTEATKVKETKNMDLPRWSTVRDLNLATSDLYQNAAAKVAAKKGTSRVHLDAIWWGRRSDDRGDD
jgi:hypothetical protein